MKVKRISLVVSCFVIMSTFYLALTILPENAQALTHYVGGSGPGNHTKIHLAITAANPGDTIFVYNGTYDEDVSVYKRLTLIGEDRNTTIIRGSGTADTVLVTVDWVNITGFTMANSASSAAGIRLFFVQNCIVTNNNISSNGNGIAFWQSSFITVRGNFISNNGRGIFFSGSASSNNHISDNSISDNGAGIYLEYHNNNRITNNTFTNNGNGVYMSFSSFNVFTNNVMSGNGILLLGSSLEHWNTHVIDQSNTIDGEPLHYWKNVTGGTIPSNAGQVILANCTNIVVGGQNNSDISVGVEVGFSSHIAINNNAVTHNTFDGIYVYGSDNVTMDGNNASNNGNDGILIRLTETTSITNNTVFLNGMNGLHVFAGESITISNNSLVSNSQSQPGPSSRMEYCAVYISYSNHSVIAENAILSNLNCAFSLINSNINTISNNNISNNGNGAFFTGGGANRVLNNTISSNRVIGISEGIASHDTIAFNTVTNHLAGILLSFSHDNTVVGNYISSKSDSSGQNGIGISFSISHVVTNNIMVGDGLLVYGDSLATWNTHVIDASNVVNGRPVRYWKNTTGGTVPLDASEVILANCTGVTVRDQDIREGAAGIVLAYSSNNTVMDNDVTQSKMAVRLHGSHGNAVRRNTVSDHLGSDAVALRWSNSNIVANNRLRGSPEGASLGTSHGNRVTENEIWNNLYYGIRLTRARSGEPGSRNNLIDNNSVFDNGLDGIHVRYSDNNTIVYNSIFGNLEGVHIGESDDNDIHHNSFIDNSLQSYDDRATNRWDDGYPSGGNWWNDYIGADTMSGPNQDVPGADGIGDTPYVIDMDSRDGYPLMTPVITSPPSAPLNLSLSPGNQQMALTWNPPSFDGGLPITNYRIYRGIASGGEIFYAQIGNVLTYLDTSLTNGQMYCYRVSALNGVGEGPMSNEACATPTTTPGAPAILQAYLSGVGLVNVTVAWNLSSDDGAGQDSVVGYSIYRGTTHDVNAVGYLLIATVPSGTIEFSDNMTGEGDPNNYFYQICAVDLNNLTNCSANQAGKFTRSLLDGPNLISIPLVQSDERIATVLQTLKWDKAWTYDSSVQKWKSHMRFKPHKGDLKEMNTSMGIWVNVMEQSNLTVAGLVPSSTSIYLHAGWNLVGFPSFNGTYAVSDLKATVGVERIEGFDASTPPYFLRALTDGDVLQTGFGFWIKMLSDGSWTVVNS